MSFIQFIYIFIMMTFSISTFAQQEEQATAQERPMSDLERELRRALSFGTPEDAISLLERGVDPNAITESLSGMTLFHSAVSYNRNVFVIRAFLERGANINTARSFVRFFNDETIYSIDDLNDETAFDSAIMSNGNPEIIRLLSENGALTNFTPLHVAVRLEDIEAIRDLLENGADVNATDQIGLGLTPLHLAAKFSEDLAVTRILLDYGADPNAAPHPYTALRPLHISARSNSNPDITRALLESGADVTSIQTNGVNMTALFYAVYSENLEVVVALLEHGSDPNYHQGNNHPMLGGYPITPLYNAVSLNKKPDIAKALLQYGADPHSEGLLYKAETNIYRAETNENNEFVEVLTEFGARPIMQ